MKEAEREKQLRVEIDWLKQKIKTVNKQKHKKDLERQIKEREYNLYLGIYKTKP